MWNYFKKMENKHAQQKLTRYDKLKINAIRKAKEKFPSLDINETYINQTLSDFLFVDRKNKTIAIYKTNSPFIAGSKFMFEEKQIITFMELELVGINYGTKSISIWSDIESSLVKKQDNLELMLKEINNYTDPDENIELVLSKNSDDFISVINIILYEKKNKLFSFNKAVNEAKMMFSCIAEALRIGEKDLFAKLEKDKYETMIYEVEELTKRIQVNVDYHKKPLVTELIKEWNFIVEYISIETYPILNYNSDSVTLLGVNEDTVYLGCEPEKVDYFNIPQIKKLISLFFYNTGFRKMEILSNAQMIKKTTLGFNDQGEQIYNEVSSMFNWAEFDGEGTYRIYQEGKLYINYDGDMLEEVQNYGFYLETNKELTLALQLLTGMAN